MCQKGDFKFAHQEPTNVKHHGIKFSWPQNLTRRVFIPIPTTLYRVTKQSVINLKP